MELKKLAILARNDSEEAQVYAQNLREEGSALIAESPECADIIAVIGGDGMMLSTIAQYRHLDKPFVGFNFGDVGFFTNPCIAPKQALGMLMESQEHFRLQSYRLLRLAYKDEGGHRHYVHAFNEVLVQRATPQSAHLDVFIDGEIINKFSGDGILVASPQGSTAYAQSAGGPIVHPGVSAIIVVPFIAQRAWIFRSLLDPVIYPATSNVEVKNRSPEKRPVHLLYDGRDGGIVSSVCVSVSRKKVLVLYLKDPRFRTGFTQRLVDKIIGPPREEE